MQTFALPGWPEDRWAGRRLVTRDAWTLLGWEWDSDSALSSSF